ncbi:MAG: acetolactate synthase small subunit [Candidatus Methylomirabilis sp.]|nr:acetolactate synthase small subunit [Deltaproteobacteria bacterium]
MKHTISVLVRNEFGVLSRVAGLFSGRGYNIDSLCVAETGEPGLSRMTIVSGGSDEIIEQIVKQLNRVIDVIKVVDLSETQHVDRELVLVKVSADDTNRGEIMRIVDIFRGKIVDVSPKSFIVEATGDEGKIRAMLELLRPMGIKEVARTGKIAMQRGMQMKGEETYKKPVATTGGV